MTTKTPGKGPKKAKAGTEKVKRVQPATKTVRLGDDLTAELQAMADDRNMSFSAVVRTAVEMYLQREQFAVALADVETNIASTLNAVRRDTGKVADDLQLVIAIMDQFIKFSMVAAPEVHDKQAATALMNRRYSGFMAELHKSFHSRKKRAVMVQELESMEGMG